jgi:glycosyltransferase involved in cell wall biosynthesis
MQAATAVAVLGEGLQELMDGFVEHSRVAVVPNGTPEFKRPPCEPDRSLVLYLSNLSRKKGADVAVRAASLVAARDERARFVFAGAWESAEFEREVRELAAPLGNRVEFLGPVAGDLKARLMGSARLLLFPVAWGEGHPRIVLEALAAGVPVVTTNRGAIRETVTDGENGFVLDDPDPDAVATCILRLLDDAKLRARFAHAARDAYLARFTQTRADEVLCAWLAAVA